jgi:hypothetical protein
MNAGCWLGGRAFRATGLVLVASVSLVVIAFNVPPVVKTARPLINFAGCCRPSRRRRLGDTHWQPCSEIRSRDCSIEIEGVFVVLFKGRVLLLFAQEAVAGDKHLDFGAHEAAEGILGSTHDWLAADVEAGVD